MNDKSIQGTTRGGRETPQDLRSLIIALWRKGELSEEEAVAALREGGCTGTDLEDATCRSRPPFCEARGGKVFSHRADGEADARPQQGQAPQG